MLYKVAALDQASDHLLTFTEFLDDFSELYDHPPCVRMLAWACYAIGTTAKRGQSAGRAGFLGMGRSGNAAVSAKIDLSAILNYEYIDQVGHPFQLENPTANHAQGRAFS